MTIDPTTQAMIDEWYGVKTKIDSYKPELEPLIDREKALRLAIVALLWPADKPENEGTQRIELGHGWKMKANVKIDRKVIEETIDQVLIDMQKALVNTTDLIKWWPDLNLKVYRKLTAEQQEMINQALTIKPASPTLELEPPK